MVWETLDLFESEGKSGIHVTDSPVLTSVSEYPVLRIHDIFGIFLTEKDFWWFYLKSAKSS